MHTTSTMRIFSLLSKPKPLTSITCLVGMALSLVTSLYFLHPTKRFETTTVATTLDLPPQILHTNPASLPFAHKTCHVRIAVRAALKSYQQLGVVADDCLQLSRVNERAYSSPHKQICTFPTPIRIGPEALNMGPSAVNLIDGEVINAGGQLGIEVRVINQYWLDLILKAVVLITTGLLGAALLKRVYAPNFNSALAATVIASVAIRLIYFDVTIPTARQHDDFGHIPYIQHLTNHLSLPTASQGWQTYSPPLYHVAGAVWLKLFTILDLDTSEPHAALQVLALLISALYLAVIVAISLELFPTSSTKLAQCLFVFLAANYPGVILLSTKAGNDGLTGLLVSAAFLFLLRWWKDPNLKKIIAFSIFLALALLTKSTALIALISFCLAIFLASHISIKQRVRYLAACLCIVATLYGWFPYSRSVEPGPKHLVGNIDKNDSTLFTERDSIWSFIIYNPWQVIQMFETRTRKEDPRREYVWEYYVKSSLFSEYAWPSKLKPLRQGMLAMVTIIIVMGIMSLYATLRHRAKGLALPCALLIAVTLLCQLAIRINVAVPALADFRYTTFLLPAFFGLLVPHVAACTSRYRTAGFAVLALFSFLIVAWFIGLWHLFPFYGVEL